MERKWCECIIIYFFSQWMGNSSATFSLCNYRSSARINMRDEGLHLTGPCTTLFYTLFQSKLISYHLFFLLFTGSTADIIQIAAECSDGTRFKRYVMPTKPISSAVERLTGISVTIDRVNLQCNGKNVIYVSPKDCFVEFVRYLQGKIKPVWMGHNIRTFDCPILMNSPSDWSQFDAPLSKCSSCIYWHFENV